MTVNEVLAIIAAALAVSEGLALIPKLKSNSVFQLIYNILKAIANGIKKERKE